MATMKYMGVMIQHDGYMLHEGMPERQPRKSKMPRVNGVEGVFAGIDNYGNVAIDTKGDVSVLLRFRRAALEIVPVGHENSVWARIMDIAIIIGDDRVPKDTLCIGKYEHADAQQLALFDVPQPTPLLLFKVPTQPAGNRAYDALFDAMVRDKDIYPDPADMTIWDGAVLRIVGIRHPLESVPQVNPAKS